RRDANAKRAGMTVDEQDVLEKIAASGRLEDLQLAARYEEATAPAAPAVLYAEIEEEAIAAAPATPKAQAIDKYLRANPDKHRAYRSGWQRAAVATKFRQAYAAALVDAEVAPVVEVLRRELAPAEASAAAWRVLPVLHEVREVLVSKARRGATVAQLER